MGKTSKQTEEINEEGNWGMCRAVACVQSFRQLHQELSMFDIQNEREWDWLTNLFVHKVFYNIQQQIIWLALKKKNETLQLDKVLMVTRVILKYTKTPGVWKITYSQSMGSICPHACFCNKVLQEHCHTHSLMCFLLLVSRNNRVAQL